jgi:MHS family proline/betaine transporter-like MFS transporter
MMLPPIETVPGTLRETRAVLAASIGNLLEWFDFSVYALFAIYIGANFFPKGDPGVGLVSAFLVFGLGFVVRPLGSIVIGNYADRAGRKPALTATVLLMGCGTLLIACAPPYTAIGLAAPLLLLTGRLLQGFSAGGEIGSAAAFLVEHAAAARKSRLSSWLQASMGMSNILGALVGFAVTALLPPDARLRWAWRIPFLLGLAYLAEAGRRHAAPTPPPLIAVFRECAPGLVLGFGISILWAVAVYVLLIFMPVFVQNAFGFTAAEAFGASLMENMVFVTGCFVFGAAADRIGQVRMLAVGAAGLSLGVVPLFLSLDAHRNLPVLVMVLCACGALVAAFTSVAPAVLAGLFPTGLRSTGVSLAYNAAFTLFGGFAPAILTWFTSTAAGSVFAPAWYVESAAVPAIAALIGMSRGAARPRVDGVPDAPSAAREPP